MKIYSFNPNFTGYSNILANNILINGYQNTLFSMQIDNKGTRDLDDFMALKKFLKLPPKEIEEDTLTIFYSRFDKNDRHLFFNNKCLFWGEELKQILNKVKNDKELKEYKNLEKFHLKVYTFLASLTNKIISNPPDKKIDQNFYRTLVYTERYLTSILSNHDASIEIIRQALYSGNIDVTLVSKNINQKIARTMRNLFL